MTAGDVVAALREQNVQVSGGALGTQPAPADNAFQLVVTTQEDLRMPGSSPMSSSSLAATDG